MNDYQSILLEDSHKIKCLLFFTNRALKAFRRYFVIFFQCNTTQREIINTKKITK